MRIFKRKPSIQRTFGYDSPGVEVRLFINKTKAGAASEIASGTIRRNRDIFGLDSIVLANNLEELEEILDNAASKGLVANFVPMFGTNVVEYTRDIKKVKKFLKTEEHS